MALTENTYQSVEEAVERGERLFRIPEFSELTGFSRTTLYNWERRGQLVPYKNVLGKKYYSDKHYKQVTGYDLDY